MKFVKFVKNTKLNTRAVCFSVNKCQEAVKYTLSSHFVSCWNHVEFSTFLIVSHRFSFILCSYLSAWDPEG